MAVGLHHKHIPLRKVVSTAPFRMSNERRNGKGSLRLVLECGHVVYAALVHGAHQKRRCWDCWYEAQNSGVKLLLKLKPDWVKQVERKKPLISGKKILQKKGQ